MELYQIVMDFCEAYGYEYRNDYSARVCLVLPV